MTKWFFMIGLCAIFLTSCNIQIKPTYRESIPLETQNHSLFQVGGVAATGSDVSVAVRSDTGNPVIAFTGTFPELRVKQWTGSAWTDIGGIVNSGLPGGPAQPSLVLDANNNPVVAWGQNQKTYVSRWNGTSWVIYGNVPVSSTLNTLEAFLALNSSGNPVVAFTNTATNDDVYVKYWNGSAWAQYGGAIDNTLSNKAHANSLTMDIDNPIISFSEDYNTAFTRSWNGTSWTAATPVTTYSTTDAVWESSSSIALDSNKNLATVYIKYYGTTTDARIFVSYRGLTYGPLNVGIGEGRYPSIAVDANNTVVVAWSELVGTSWNNYVKRLTGTTWELVSGGPLDINPANQVSTNWVNALAINNGNIAVAWVEDTSGIGLDNIYVKTNYTTAWEPLGGTLNTSVNNIAIAASITRKSDNTPVVAWQETVGSSTDIYVKQRVGSSWVALGGAVETSQATNASNPDLAMRSDDKPVIALGDDSNIVVKQWSGSLWTSIGGVLDIVTANISGGASLALDSSNNPVVAWHENVSTSATPLYNIYVKKWNGTAWVTYDGTTTPLDIVSTKDALLPSLALDSSGNPTVAWAEDVSTTTSKTYNVYVKKWTGSTWTQLGGAVDITVANSTVNPAIALESNGTPVVAIQDLSNIAVMRWSGTAWTPLGGTTPLDIIASRVARLPSLVMGFGNKPIVTWQETEANVAGGLSFNIYAKRYTGTIWTSLTPTNTELDTVVASDARTPDIVLRTDNSPIVVWDEKATTTGATQNIFAKIY
jgi:hypothetical protein